MKSSNLNISEYKIMLENDESNDELINFLLYNTEDEKIIEKLSILNESQINSLELKYENEIKKLQNNLQKTNKINDEITKYFDTSDEKICKIKKQ